MKLGDTRRLIIGAVVVVACSAALAFHFVGGSRDSDSNLVGLAPRTAAAADEDTEAATERSFQEYTVVTQRNMFSPLVAPPPDPASLAVPEDVPSPTSSGEPARREPPDPTRNLAMTGLVESNSGLLALIKDVETGKSVYAGVGDEAFNLRVASIGAKTITLARDDREYKIGMGEKDIPEAESTASGTPSSGEGASGAPQEAGRGPGGGPPPGRFGPGDMMRRLEENRSRMTAEQYERARRYLQMRSSGGGGGFRGGGGSRGGGGDRGRGR